MLLFVERRAARKPFRARITGHALDLRGSFGSSEKLGSWQWVPGGGQAGCTPPALSLLGCTAQRDHQGGLHGRATVGPLLRRALCLGEGSAVAILKLFIFK